MVNGSIGRLAEAPATGTTVQSDSDVALSWVNNDDSGDGGIDIERRVVHITDSFDDGNLHGWTGFAPSTTQAYDGTYSATDDGTNGRKLDSPTFTVPSTILESRVWVYIPSGSLDGQHINAFYKSGSNWCGPHVQVRSSGNIEYYDGSWNDTGQDAPVDTWFLSRAVIDVPNQSFDLYHLPNGGSETQIATGAAFISRASFSGGDKRFFRITNAGGTDVYYDNIDIRETAWANVTTGLSTSTTSYTDSTASKNTTYEYRVERNTNHATTISGTASAFVPLNITIDGTTVTEVTIDGEAVTSLTIDGTTIF